MIPWLRRLVPRLLPLAALLILLLPAIQPLLAGHLPWRADGLLHFHRLAQLERAVSLGALYPRWLPGEILTDDYQLGLPPDLPSGAYELRVGLYNPVDGRHLPLRRSANDYWTLPISITGSE